jgi:hypothetical protein
MSWDAVILRVCNSAWPIGEAADQEYLPVGTAASVAAAIADFFPTAERPLPTQACLPLDHYTSVTFDLKHVETSDSIHVSVSGPGNPVPALLSLANANGWVVLDCGTGAFLDPTGVSTEGVDGYHALRRTVLEKYSDEK